MLVTKTPLGADTFGGYVNVSKQDINRSSPAILDMIINDLAEQYAIATELETGTTLTDCRDGGSRYPDRSRDSGGRRDRYLGRRWSSVRRRPKVRVRRSSLSPLTCWE